MNYRPKIADGLLNLKLQTLGAVEIVGRRGCGKTATAKRRRQKVSLNFRTGTDAGSIFPSLKQCLRNCLSVKDPDYSTNDRMLRNSGGAVRKSVDDEQLCGAYILTDSASKKMTTPHTGTPRISTLKMYSMSLFESGESDGTASYYHDRYDLEADAVLHLGNGKYALIEIKLGANEIDKGAEHLCKIEKLIREYNEKENQVPIRLPDLKTVLTATEYGYRRDDGVLVMPIGCLRD